MKPVAGSAGIEDSETFALLDATTFNTDPMQGIDPVSVGQGMTELASFVQRSPAPWTAFVIHDTTTDTYIWTEPDSGPSAPGLLDEDVQLIAGVGRLLHDASGQPVLVTADGTPIGLGLWVIDPPTSEAQQLAIAHSFAFGTAAEIDGLRRNTEALVRGLPALLEVPIGGQALVVRGGTVELPVALCLRNQTAEACHFNAVSRRPDRQTFTQMSTTKVTLDGEWFVIGYNQGAVGIDGNVLAPRTLCAAGADGVLTEVLPDVRVSVDGREYFTAAIPATVDFVRSCYLDGGVLTAASSGMLVRPVE